MKFYEILYYTQIVGATLVFLTSIILVAIMYIGALYTDKLSKKVYNLGKGITSENVEDYIDYLDAKYIPFRFYTTNLIKSGYKLINMDAKIDEQLKQRVKIKILSRGILVD